MVKVKEKKAVKPRGKSGMVWHAIFVRASLWLVFSIFVSVLSVSTVWFSALHMPLEHALVFFLVISPLCKRICFFFLKSCTKYIKNELHIEAKTIILMSF